jgi:hypothetical protein
MKRLLTILPACIVLSTFSIAQNTPPASSGKHSLPVESPSAHHRTWVLVLTPETTKHQLDSVASAWAKDNITLKFSQADYDNKGKLIKIKGSVDIQSGGHHASGTFGPDHFPMEIKLDDRPSVSLKDL